MHTNGALLMSSTILLVSVYTLAAAQVSITASPSLSVTQGDKVTLTCIANITNTNGFSYTWIKNNHIIRPANKQSLEFVAERDGDVYICLVKWESMNKVFAEVTIHVQCLLDNKTIIASMFGAMSFIVLIVASLFAVNFILQKRAQSLVFKELEVTEDHPYEDMEGRSPYYIIMNQRAHVVYENVSPRYTAGSQSKAEHVA
ncbi:uncharacterized protein LOC121302877 [Polyodon spathula]|uniref:uncharacterized protein LOC121302877 n=1 Tax=Polyodon spathula TaxID=7913 RepID=UPI001B7E6A2F|nr:uncharacterized protein LOC121302877 [Polyodon spathula]XP_041089237.1 uncharacterized protein LOC121302877 [Polyodon spathula]XP_041089313.1 uncharacterized protein LOC121302877 [Polyodon spathula]